MTTLTGRGSSPESRESGFETGTDESRPDTITDAVGEFRPASRGVRKFAYTTEPVMLGELEEQLAAIEHERWGDWQKYMHSQGGQPPLWDEEAKEVARNGLWFSRKQVDRWHLQIVTPYEQLSEREKQSDREQVARYWPLVQAEIARQRREAAEEFAGRVKARYRNYVDVVGNTHSVVDLEQIDVELARSTNGGERE